MSERTAGTNVEHDGVRGGIAKEECQAEGGEDVVGDDVLGEVLKEGGEERGEGCEGGRIAPAQIHIHNHS